MALLALIVPLLPAVAQDAADTVAADTVPEPPRPIAPADYGKWESLGFGELSPNGEWMAVPISRVNDENELRIHRVGADSVVVIPYGRQAAFSGDGRWAAYLIGLSEDEREAMERREERPEQSLGLLDLGSGDTTLIAGVSAFELSDDGRFLAMRRYPAGQAQGDDAHGADLVVRELATGTDVNFGNVGEFAWQEDGPLLAMTVDAADNAGNGVRVWDADDGAIRVLDSRPADYSELRWRDDAPDLVVLRAREDDDREKPTHAVLAWKDVEGRTRAFAFEPATREDFPADTRIVEYRAPAFSEDGEAVFFGLQEWEYTDEALERMEAEADTTAAEGEDAGEGEPEGGADDEEEEP
ncbi:MAG: hypothetical protein R3314_12035, partial [Longimicrobiales bacterium]|nr:hypothetical protein [Longimicrobiales bacterium]